MFDERLRPVWWALRFTFGVVPILAGLDKFFHLLTNWTQYLSPLATRVVPVEPHTFMYGVGIIEMVAGSIVLFTPWVKLGGLLVGSWLLLIVLNLLSTGNYFDIAVRDLAMAIGAFSLVRLEQVRTEAAEVVRRDTGLRPADAHV